MSTSLLVFVPVALLFIVSGLCFVGCLLDSTGYGDVPTTPSDYSNNDVLSNASVVAYWPLSEALAIAGEPVDTAIAVDAAGTANGTPHNGNYTHKGNAPDLFPCPDFDIGMQPIHSTAALGFLGLGTETIVPGDFTPAGELPKVVMTGMQVNGGFVSVPFPDVVDPNTFTVEAWVRPEWTDTDVPATRAVVDSRSVMGGAVTGFVLWVNQDGKWEGLLNGTNAGVLSVTSTDAAVLGDPSHVVLTFDGTNASLFVNGTSAGGPTAFPAGSTFVLNTTEPLIIGAGFKFLPSRTAAHEDQAFPLIPFNGTIQDVAIYNSVLSNTVINTHFFHGNGKDVPAP